VKASSGVTTFLFTDIEGSTRLWDREHDRMQVALARHDAIVRAAVEGNHGIVVKMSGDGAHGAFDDPLDALGATLQLQQGLADPASTHGVALRVRCGLHAGVTERRDNDFFGGAVNRAARIMGVAHGGQVLLSQAVATLVGGRLPPGTGLLDLGTVRLRDLENPERVFQLVHPDLRRDFPSLRSLEATPNNLPQQLSSFVGRERELAEITRLLSWARLVTLFGPGGIGKTRLSLQVGADALESFPDGVWFVELAPIADPLLVPQAVASVLGVKEEAGHPVSEALVRYVKDRRVLVILDNCEHLLQSCADLVKLLLQAGPHLKILASSREHLRVAGETSHPVPPLPVPGPAEADSVTTGTQFAAVRLFAERAASARPSFALTAQNAGAVADICRRLDGIPLAIELAAARVRTLSVETIGTRLSERFRLLTDGDRTALPRQQTLRALIDWSHNLLTDPERALLRRLAVFAGGWTLEAAEGVASGGNLEKSEVIEVLTNLVEKSLVLIEPAEQRYRLLETVREYAQEQLQQSGEEGAVRTRHLAFYLALTEKARPELNGPDQGSWLRQLDLDRENILLAHAWCDHAKEGAEWGLRLVESIRPYWFSRGLLALRLRLAVEALQREGAQVPNQARCLGLFSAGQACCFMGRYTDAQDFLSASLSIARTVQNQERVEAVLELLGMVAFAQGDLIAARGYLEEARALAQRAGNPRQLAAALNGLAQVHRAEGNLDAAQPLYTEFLALARALGDRENIAIGLLNLAMVSIGRGNSDGVCAALLDALAIAEEIGFRPAGQSVLEVSAGLAALFEQWEHAANFFGVAEAQTEQTGLHRDPADEAFLLPLVTGARKALGAGAFAAAENAGRQRSYPEAIADVRLWLQGKA
jgi:predicted ATPase/class 3 adenylate cyclase